MTRWLHAKFLVCDFPAGLELVLLHVKMVL